MTMTRAEAKQELKDISQAWEIVEQLGGTHFLCMTGANHFSRKSSGVNITFRFMGSPVTNLCSIELNERDLYDVKFYRRTTYELYREYNDVYAESLQSVFTEATGLDTHL